MHVRVCVCALCPMPADYVLAKAVRIFGESVKQHRWTGSVLVRSEKSVDLVVWIPMREDPKRSLPSPQLLFSKSSLL